MSTVDKTMADRVISGEYPEDEVFLIIRYENMFNGNYAYKLYRRYYAIRSIDALLADIARIAGDNPLVYHIDSSIVAKEDIKFITNILGTIPVSSN